MGKGAGTSDAISDENQIRVSVPTPRPRQFTPQDRELALFFLEASREGKNEEDENRRFALRVRDAARRCNVPEALLRDWAGGGHLGVLDLEAPLPPASVFERPMPPEALLDPDVERKLFLPAHDCMAWIRAVYIEDGGPLWNEVHFHLLTAKIGVVWTNVENVKNGKRIAGTCEWLGGGGAIWPKGRQECQYEGWFGEVPDFLITFDAKIAAVNSDREWCSTAEHELLHAGIKRNANGPQFDRYGRPMYALRAHDAEEFVDCGERYGIDATAGQTRELVAVCNRRPFFTDDDIARACGRT